MEKLSLSSSPSPSIPRPFLPSLLPVTRARKHVSFPPLCNPRKFSVFASMEESNNNFNQWDLMELKFGRMLGEDPKLTLAKIMGRKTNPDASYIEIEKNFYKNKGKLVEVKEVPFDVPEKRGSVKAANELNLVRPVLKKGIKVGASEDNSKLPEIKRPNESIRNKMDSVTKPNVPNSKLPEIKRPNESIRNKVDSVCKPNVSSFVLRKPSVFNEKDDEMDSSSRPRINPNSSLSMRTEPVKEKFSGMTLLKKPEPASVNEDHGGESENDSMNGSVYSGPTSRSAKDIEDVNGGRSAMTNSGEFTLLEKPNAIMHQNNEGNRSAILSNVIAGLMGDHIEGFPESDTDLVSEQDQIGEGYPTGKEARMSIPPIGILGRPKRLDQSMKEMSHPIPDETLSMYPESFDDEGEQEKPTFSRPLKEIEENDWTLIEKYFNNGERVEVELISCSPRGFVVSFGSLIGFLPYRNLVAKWKFLAFESWLRRNGVDPSKYRQNLGIIGNEEFPNKSTSLESSPFPEVSQQVDLKDRADMELEDLLGIYDQEKIQYLSSYVGQHIKVHILLADRKSRKLIVSMRQKEKDEMVEKKRTLMAKLSIGDVVKCCIKRITYFGIFVEVEGVPALIHQTEVSWDATLDPSSYLKIGQIVEAKVHQLDFALERIFLSLKEITPDPLNEALECIVGNNSFNGGFEAAQADSEWADVDLLIKELQNIDGVQTATKGRFFLSPGLAPTFQVYMASVFENQYKLLARSGNKVQEVMVQASLDKEEMKSAILKCTNRVDL